MSFLKNKIFNIIKSNEPSFFTIHDSMINNQLIFKEYFWAPSKIKLLINYGLNINTIDEKNRNVSFYCDNLASLRVLIKCGLDLNLQDNDGKTPLFYLRNKIIINELLANNINLNILDDNGNNFLSYYNFYFSTNSILKKSFLISKKEFPVRHLFSNATDTLLEGIKNGLYGYFSEEVTLEFNPFNNPETTKRILTLANSGKVKFYKDTRFIIPNHFLTTKFKGNQFTLHELNTIFNSKQGLTQRS